MKKQTPDKQREALLKEIAIIQTMKKPAQWRAAKEFALKVNPSLRKEDSLFMQEIETLREQQDNDDARSADGSLRFSMSIPVSIMQAIRQFDPEFMIYDKQNKAKYKTKRSTNKEVRKLMKVFPEYKIPRDSL